MYSADEEQSHETDVRRSQVSLICTNDDHVEQLNVDHFDGKILQINCIQRLFAWYVAQSAYEM